MSLRDILMCILFRIVKLSTYTDNHNVTTTKLANRGDLRKDIQPRKAKGIIACEKVKYFVEENNKEIIVLKTFNYVICSYGIFENSSVNDLEI